MYCMPEYSATPPEKYSSYKARKFEKYRAKIDGILKGIDDLSLKSNDKDKLREELIQRLSKK